MSSRSSQSLLVTSGALLILLLIGVASLVGRVPHPVEGAFWVVPTLVPSLTLTSSPTATPTPTILPPTPTPTSTPSPSPTPTMVSPPSTPTPTSPLTAADVCADEEGEVLRGTFYSPTLGRSMRYRVYLPPCYDEANRLFPVLYIFHGMGYTDSQWDVLGLDEAVDAGVRSGRLSPFIIVMPNAGSIANTTDGGPGSFETVVVEELMPFIADNFCTWETRRARAIGGLSRGGFWALEIALRHPTLFARVGAHSPGLFWDNAIPAYNPLYLASDAPGIERVQVYIDVGRSDWLRSGAQTMDRLLEERGIAHQFLLRPGEHSDAYWASHVAEYAAFYAQDWPRDWRDLPQRFTCPDDFLSPSCRRQWRGRDFRCRPPGLVRQR